MNRGEEAGNCREEEASFLVGNCREKHYARDCAEERETWWTYRWGDSGQEKQGRPKEEGQRGQEMLVEWMEAVRGKIRVLRIVEERINWCDYRRSDESGEGGGRVVESRICYYGENGSEQTGGQEGYDRKWSV